MNGSKATRRIIAIDVDDVLADHVQAFVAWSNERYGGDLTVDTYVDHWSEFWGTSHEETEARAQLFHDEHHHRHFAAKDEALAVIEYLKRDYDLVVVTARRAAVVEDSRQWLAEHFPGVFEDIRFVPIWDKGNTITKADICRELGAEYLIDDMVRHCEAAVNAGVVALLFGDYNWNKQFDPSSGVIRVRDWQAVKDFFDARRV